MAGLATSALSLSSAAAASAASASGASPVLELALDHLGLGATAGAHNPLDILVIGSQDGLQLQCEGVKLHFGVYFHHCALMLECLCIHAVLKIESMVRACRCDLCSFIFYTTKYLPEVH